MEKVVRIILHMKETKNEPRPQRPIHNHQDIIWSKVCSIIVAKKMFFCKWKSEIYNFLISIYKTLATIMDQSSLHTSPTDQLLGSRWGFPEHFNVWSKQTAMQQPADRLEEHRESISSGIYSEKEQIHFKTHSCFKWHCFNSTFYLIRQ